MASKTGSFLRTSDRQKILRDLQQKGELELAPESLRIEAEEALNTLIQEQKGKCSHHHAMMEVESFGTGCLACGEDDDHANLLLCEACNAEYHTYCLETPLRSVPTGDWFCAECKAGMTHFDEDGLDALVEVLSPCFTSRFGEVCWAQGGQGFGWWPAFIYDPRMTIGNARQLAKKNLGKRHLVYFFECHDAPFSVLHTSKVTKWDDGLIDDFHLGKTARSAGQKRSKSFRGALQAATLEAQKPIEMRMDWNHSDQPQILPSPQANKVPPPRKRQRREVSPVKRLPLEKATRSSSPSSAGRPKPRSKPRGFPLLPNLHTEEEMSQVPTKRNLALALEGLIATASRRIVNPIVEPAEDGPLFVKLLRKTSLPIEDSEGRAWQGSEKVSKLCKNVGFVKVASRKSSTFADTRAAMLEDLETLVPSTQWRFFVPGLGPMSRKQETDMGAMYPFLRRTTMEQHLGDGTPLHPLKVFLVELETESVTTTIPTLTPARAADTIT